MSPAPRRPRPGARGGTRRRGSPHGAAWEAARSAGPGSARAGALRQLTRRDCLSVANAVSGASFSARARAEHHSGVGARAPTAEVVATGGGPRRRCVEDGAPWHGRMGRHVASLLATTGVDGPSAVSGPRNWPIAPTPPSGAHKSRTHMLRRYCPPTSNSASVIWPSEQQRTASISTSNTFWLSITACFRRCSCSGASAAWRVWKSARR